jgi:hypothetical protein
VVNDPPTRKNLFSLVVEVTGAAIVRSAVVGIVVQKYGGSSVADAEGIKRVAPPMS